MALCANYTPTLRLLIVFTLLATPASPGNTLSTLALHDSLHGMWLGQLIGNATGRSTEGLYDGAEPNPDVSVPWELKQLWDADDDTDIEYLALHILETWGFNCTPANIATEWLEHLTPQGLYLANKQAWSLMIDGYLPPDTGSRTYNQHWYSIDAQIGTEVLGALSPGMPSVAAALTDRFARITNSDLAVHAAQFYAAMYSNAFLEPDVVLLVEGALPYVPPTSRTYTVINDVLHWYYEDLNDGHLDWRATRRRLYDTYQGSLSFGRYYNWVESTINTGVTVLALLYGQGDFRTTVQIAVLCGWDSDCNPATAGGLLGIIHGFTGLPSEFTDPASAGDVYLNVSRPGLPDPNAPLPQSEPLPRVADRMLALARENILRNGGSLQHGRFETLYRVPDPPIPSSDVNNTRVIGPGSLVDRARAASVVVTPSASVAGYDSSADRTNLATLIDAIVENADNGMRPYRTHAPGKLSPAGQDWYQLAFSEPVLFDGLVFYEGDILWSRINAYYRDDHARGGFFTDLTVQIRRDGTYIEPADLVMSEPLDPFAMYQVIAFRFSPTVGDAIRIIGTPGGTEGFTTILELEPQGELLP